MCAPAHEGWTRRIVAGIVILRRGDGLSGRNVPQVLLFQRVRVVFGMPRDEKLLMFPRVYGIDTRPLRGSKDLQAGSVFDLCPVYRCMPGVGDVERVVKAAEEDAVAVFHPVGINPK